MHLHCIQTPQLCHHNMEAVMHFLVYIYTAKVPEPQAAPRQSNCAISDQDALLEDLQSALDRLLLGDELLFPALQVHCQLCVCHLLIQLRNGPAGREDLVSQQDISHICGIMNTELIEHTIFRKGARLSHSSIPANAHRRRGLGSVRLGSEAAAVSRLLCWSGLRVENGLLPALGLQVVSGTGNASAAADDDAAATLPLSYRTTSASGRASAPVALDFSITICHESLQVLGTSDATLSLSSSVMHVHGHSSGFFSKAKTLDDVESFLTKVHALSLVTDMKKQLEHNRNDLNDLNGINEYDHNNNINNNDMAWPQSPIGWDMELEVSGFVLRCHRALLVTRSTG
jgi:hypothetical protein